MQVAQVGSSGKPTEVEMSVQTFLRECSWHPHLLGKEGGGGEGRDRTEAEVELP